MIDRAIIIPDFMILIKEISKSPVCASDVQASTNMTYSYIHYMKKHFATKGWVTIHKEGVAHMMHITEKGMEVVEAIDNLMEVLGIDYEDIMKYRRRRKESKRKAGEQPVIDDEDNEELSEETKQVISERMKEVEEGKTMSSEELKARLSSGEENIDEEFEEDFKEELSEDDLAEFEEDVNVEEEKKEKKSVNLNSGITFGEPESASPEDLEEMEKELDVEEDWELDEDEENAGY